MHCRTYISARFAAYPAGIIPECTIVCYFGSLSENISQIASGKAGPSGVVTYVLVGVTVFFMVAAVTWSTFVVRSVTSSSLVMAMKHPKT